MIFFTIIGFGIGTFVVVFLYQHILTSKLKRLKKILFTVLLTILIVFAAFLRLQYVNANSLEAKVLRPIASPIQKGVELVNEVRMSEGLQKAILPILENEKGEYSVVVKNLKTGEFYNLNEKHVYTSASLYKLWTMGTVFQKIEDGELTMEKTLSASIPTLNAAFNLGEDAEATQGAITRTVETALEQMITISHNYSAILLTYNIKNASVQKFLKDNAFSDSQTKTIPTTNAKDIASYFEKLYKGELVSKEASNQMLEILKRQELNDRIPKYLPERTVVAHKTGELYGVKHDAGIVYSEKDDYIIVLMSDTASQTKAAEVEAKISKAVWEYFN
jgi:beta-lactamase class A